MDDADSEAETVELEYPQLDRSEKARLIWALLWRFLIMLALSMAITWVLQLVAGGVGGLMASLANRNVDSLEWLWRLTGRFVSIVVQIAALMVWFKWILRVRTRRTRITLIAERSRRPASS